MALDLAELKRIKSSDTDLIFGYFRQSHKRLFPQDDPYYSIQPLIIYICLAFYHCKHEWDTDNMHANCIIDGESLTNTVRDHCTCFLKEQISKGIHEYKFKIIKYGYDTFYYDMGIGILSGKYEMGSMINDCYAYNKGVQGYCYYASRGKREHAGTNSLYGVKCEFNDIVTMIVDLEQLQLRYQVNDKDHGVAYDLPQATYRIAVYLFEENAEIEIIQP